MKMKKPLVISGKIRVGSCGYGNEGRQYELYINKSKNEEDITIHPICFTNREDGWDVVNALIEIIEQQKCLVLEEI
jgi:hypothetical protein